MDKVIISEGQTLRDVALQELGSIDAIYELAIANGLNYISTLSAGQELKISDILRAKYDAYKDVSIQFKRESYRVKTGAFEDSALFEGDFDEEDNNDSDFLT